MDVFRTIVKPAKPDTEISLDTPIMTIGSCFSDAIGRRLQEHKFKVLINPFGATYNPLSIHRLLAYSSEKRQINVSELVRPHEAFVHYDFHSQLSSLHADNAAAIINQALADTHRFLEKTSRIMITYGTAWVYRRKDTGEVVANCHKNAAGLFQKDLLSVEEIVSSFKKVKELLQKEQPDLEFVITISPVRHLKDSLEFNSASKAVLRVACHEIASLQNANYFPAYEIMMDDLRDYRFYKSDMLHPTEEAEEYIWKSFTETYLNLESLQFLKEWSGILAAMKHKPFHPHSASHQQFLESLLQKLASLSKKVDTSEEIAIVKKQLLNVV